MQKNHSWILGVGFLCAVCGLELVLFIMLCCVVFGPVYGTNCDALVPALLSAGVGMFVLAGWLIFASTKKDKPQQVPWVLQSMSATLIVLSLLIIFGTMNRQQIQGSVNSKLDELRSGPGVPTQ